MNISANISPDAIILVLRILEKYLTENIKT